jgi:pilus assembly protein Flp/PilA
MVIMLKQKKPFQPEHPMSKILAYLKDQNGASAAEYALGMALFGAGVTGPAAFLNNTVGSALYGAGLFIKTLATGGHC